MSNSGDPTLKENEEIEEGEKPDYIDLDKDGDKEESMKKAAADKEKQEESKIQTPEQENTLYEQRFAPKNNRLFEKLGKTVDRIKWYNSRVNYGK